MNFYNFDKVRNEEQIALDMLPMPKPKDIFTGKIIKMGVAKWKAKAEKQREHLRHALIYKEHLKSDDKKANLPLLAEKWGFRTDSGELDTKRVSSIITNQKATGVRLARMAGEIEAIRMIKQAQTIDNVAEYMGFLQQTLEDLQALADNKEKYIEVEIEETIKDGGGQTKIKRIPIEVAIKNCFTQIMQLGEMEAKALKDYDGVPANIRLTKNSNLTIITQKADKDFLEQLNKIQGNSNEENISNIPLVDVNRPSN